MVTTLRFATRRRSQSTDFRSVCKRRPNDFAFHIAYRSSCKLHGHDVFDFSCVLACDRSIDSGHDQTTADGFQYSGGRLPSDLCCEPGVEARLLKPPRRLLDVDLDANDRVIQWTSSGVEMAPISCLVVSDDREISIALVTRL